MGSTTTERTISGLGLILATYGLLEEVVSNKEHSLRPLNLLNSCA